MIESRLVSGLLVAGLAARAVGAQLPDAPRRVSKEAIEAAMRVEAAKGYELKATSNGARLLPAVLLALARDAAASDPSGTPLLVGHDEYFQAYVAVVGTTAEDAPVFARVPHDNKEDQIIEYRRDRVLRGSPNRSPAMALAVCGGWPEPGPARYTFDDETTSPNLRSIHQRVNSYYLIDVEGLVVLQNISGIGGRATSGLLGAMFAILGDATAVESRSGVTDDNTQVVRATAKKGPFTKSETVMVTPAGVGSANIPGDRADLQALATRLESPISFDYVPFSCDPGRNLTAPAP
jgi:hypothetical protein